MIIVVQFDITKIRLNLQLMKLFTQRVKKDLKKTDHQVAFFIFLSIFVVVRSAVFYSCYEDSSDSIYCLNKIIITIKILHYYYDYWNTERDQTTRG